MRSLGRGLQLMGLVLPLTGLMISLESGGTDAMAYEFGLLIAGVVCFLIGHQLQKEA